MVETQRQAAGGRPTFGILYPGEMGSTLGRLLRREGFPVVTTAEGRSGRTRRLAEEAGLEVLGCVAEVARAAEVVISTVHPAAAAAVAETYASCRPPEPRLYLDVNSVAPGTVTAIADRLARVGVELVDGAIHGLAALLPARGTLYLSGPAAGRAAGLLGGCLPVRVLGEEVGKAKTFKVLISGLPKGLAALFLEMSLAARRAGLLDELLACYRDAYPGVMAVVDRLLPTYPRHAARRGEELEEAEHTLQALGLDPCMIHAARLLTAEVGRLGVKDGDAAAEHWSVRGVIEALDEGKLLRSAPEGKQLPEPGTTPGDSTRFNGMATAGAGKASGS